MSAHERRLREHARALLREWSQPTDRPCLICRETIVPTDGENLCHECGDKLAHVAELSEQCARYSRDHSSTPLNKNPHFLPAERAHLDLLGLAPWACEKCLHVMPQINEHSKSACCNARISIDRQGE